MLNEKILKWKETKKYLASLGLELGPYCLGQNKNVVLKEDLTSPDSYKKVVGYITCGDFDSLSIEV
jgi:hypothetical protein